MKWVYFSTDEKSAFAPLEKLEALAVDGKLTLQGSRRQVDLLEPCRASAPATGIAVPGEAEAADTEEDDDIIDIL